MKSGNFKAYAAWVTICILWGTTYLAIKVGVTDLPPMLFAGVRWLCAFAIMFPYLKFKGYKLPNKQDLKRIAIVGLMLLGVGNGLIVVSEQWLPSGLTAIMVTTMPFWVFIIESILPKGPKPNLLVIFGLILGFLGVSLIFSAEFSNLFELENLLGILSILIAVASWAGGSVYSKFKPVSVNPFMGAAFQMLFAGSAQTIIGISIGELPHFNFPTTESLYAFLYLAFFASILGYGNYIYAIKHLPVSFVTTYTYINPIIALVLGWLFLEEKLNWEILVASIVIIVGVILVKKGSFKKVVKNPVET